MVPRNSKKPGYWPRLVFLLKKGRVANTAGGFSSAGHWLTQSVAISLPEKSISFLDCSTRSILLSILSLSEKHLLRGTIVNTWYQVPGMTYGTHKKTYISLFLGSIFGPINHGPP